MLELPLVLNWRIHHSYTSSSHFFLFLSGFREWRWSSSSFSQTGLCGYRLLMVFIFIKLNKKSSVRWELESTPNQWCKLWHKTNNLRCFCFRRNGCDVIFTSTDYLHTLQIYTYYIIYFINSWHVCQSWRKWWQNRTMPWPWRQRSTRDHEMRSAKWKRIMKRK